MPNGINSTKFVTDYLCSQLYIHTYVHFILLTNREHTWEVGRAGWQGPEDHENVYKNAT